MTIRTYTEMLRYPTFEERYAYLQLRGGVGHATFGFDRYLNQRFYTAREWRQLRNHIIARDEGCDLAVEGYDIFTKIIIHHMNPLTVDDVIHGEDKLLDPEFLITTTLRTHNAIHFGDERQLPKRYVDRRPGDTRLW